jgi:hypothetical protein
LSSAPTPQKRGKPAIAQGPEKRLQEHCSHCDSSLMADELAEKLDGKNVERLEKISDEQYQS